MALRTELYQLTQEELLTLIKKELDKAKINYKEDKYGNIWSFNHKDSPAFVAHCDTVIGGDEKYKIPVEIKDGKLSRPKTVLGADDRAGVNLILNHKENINFILTKDEEIGCLGAKALAKTKEFVDDCENITWFCELDRKNGKDILGNVHGYCSKELAEAVLKILPTHKDVRGVFTDIDEFVDITQGINLSVGYYNPHTIVEFLKIEEFDYIDSKIVEISKIEGFRAKHEKPKRKSYYFNYKDYERCCEFCGEKHSNVRYVKGALICSDCLTDFHSFLFPDIEPKKCDVCNSIIAPNERHHIIEGWDCVLCQYCVEVKY